MILYRRLANNNTQDILTDNLNESEKTAVYVTTLKIF